MHFVNSLVGIFVIGFIIQVESDYTDDPPATNDLYGQYMCCYFAFDWVVDMETMKQSTPNPKFYAPATLEKSKIAFTESYDPCDPTKFYATIVDDPVAVLPGVAYLLSLNDYDTFLKSETIYNGARYAYAKTLNIQVTLNGQTTTTNCNTFLSAGKPPLKPCRSDKDRLADIFKKVGFCQTYVDTISAIPSNPDC